MLIANQRGQGLIEYLILVALMGVATIGIVRLLNHTLNAQFADITNALQGKPRRARIESVQESNYQKKDLSNFMNGAASQKGQ